MSKETKDRLEARMKELFKEAPEFHPDIKWREKVMLSVRDVAAGKQLRTLPVPHLFQNRALARLAMASIAVALICAAVYISAGGYNTTQKEYAVEVPYNSYEHTVNLIAGL